MKYITILLASLLWMNSLTAQTTKQETAFLGIYSEQLPKEKVRKLGFDNLYGSYVTRIVENSAAERAGVKPLDYIYGIDEYRTGKEQKLTQVIRKYSPGQEATLHLYRRDNKRALNVTFGARSESQGKERDKCEDPFLGISAIGKKENAPEGVPVNIINNSSAKDIGMENGDLVISINGYRMLDWQDVSAAINAMEVGEKITVNILRDGKKKAVSGPIKSYCETKPEKTMDMNIEVAPQPGEWFDRYFKKGDDTNTFSEKAGEVYINIQPLSSDEGTKLRREKGMEIEASNNLEVEELSIEYDDGEFEMEFTLPRSGETSVRIFNTSGRLIYLYDLGNFSGEFRDEANFSQNGAGTFYLEIRQGSRSTAKKVTLSSK